MLTMSNSESLPESMESRCHSSTRRQNHVTPDFEVRAGFKFPILGNLQRFFYTSQSESKRQGLPKSLWRLSRAPS